MKIWKFITMLVVIVSLGACYLNQTESKERSAVTETPPSQNITLYDKKNSLQYVVSSEQDSAAFTGAVKGAKKMGGIMNMAEPSYEFTINKDMYSLWLSPEKGSTAAIMNYQDTHTVYRVNGRLAEELKAAVSHIMEQQRKLG
ncbi:hypothetical protein ACFQPF_07305 [Fictibacillus iocasae]|uniref:YhfM-like domain-containing protein n=1 Tax=Fictibacillus iocasae TaxID=2715437 RepID=A0ABW2NQQ5_9BACL